MRYDLIGGTGLRVSELCLGAGTFGVESWGASREDAARMLDLYTEAGGNFVDTANVYGAGRSEECVGELLTGRRDEFVLATKVSSMTRPGDVNSAGNHRKNLVASLESSLRRLRTDHVDLLWLHTRDAFTPVEEVMRALDDLVRAGKVLYVGASNWPAWEVSRANMLAELRGWSAFAGIQVRYNLLERTVERELLPMAAACDVSVFAWGPLAEGRLTGKYLHGGRGRLSVENWAGDDAVLPILGATRPEQLQDTLGVLDLLLDEEHTKRLDAVSEPSLGFPRAFMRNPKFTKGTYGDRWQRLERRGGPGRTVDTLV
jgi:aryl-alcohol dehydrogenase-like predicted oxidoreductase